MSLRKVLIATDLGPKSMRALTVGATLAKLHGAEVEVVHVLPLPDFTRPLATPDAARMVADPAVYMEAAEKSAAARIVEQSLHAAPLADARPVVRWGDPATAVLEHAGESGAELVVVGTGEVEIGEVAGRVMAHANCGVLAVPDEPSAPLRTTVAPELVAGMVAPPQADRRN